MTSPPPSATPPPPLGPAAAALARRAQRYPRLAPVAVGLAVLVGLTGAALGFEAVARAHLAAPGSNAPTRLYTRSFTLPVGAVVDPPRAERTLRRLGYRPVQTATVRPGEYKIAWDGWTVGRRAFEAAAGPDPGGLTYVSLAGDQVVSVTDSAGQPLPALLLEPEILRTVQGADLSDRVPVALDAMPEHLVQAVLAVEDRRFYTHSGLDLIRMAGATVANTRAGRITQGASTITQQLARTLFLSRQRTPWRKLREIAMALTLEWRYSKPEILEAYLNEVYLGQDGALAVRGVGRAARYYFGKGVSELDAGESAMLAGIIRGPILYAPFRDPKLARTRRDLVLDIMLDQKVLTPEQHRTAKKAALTVRRQVTPPGSGRYFSDWVVQYLTERSITDPGLKVYTTVEADMQRMADDAVARGVKRLEQDFPTLKRAEQPLEASLVALDPRTGEVLALVGGREYGVTQFNRVVQSRRQPGSAFKPVVALAALTPVRGWVDDTTFGEAPPFTLATELINDTLEVEAADGIWRPVNYDSSFTGHVTLRDALERSLNVPFARLGMAVGPDRVAEMGHSLGIEGPLQEVPSLALGASEVTLLELTRAYGVIAAYGYRAPTVNLLALHDAYGDAYDVAPSPGETVADSAVTYLVTSALQGVVNNGTGRGLRGWGVAGPFAGKTGTTNGNRDAWFVGYSPDLVVGVWVGFDDGHNLGLSGAGAALPIFADFVRGIGEDQPEDFAVPAGVEFAYAGQECRREAFLAGTVPPEPCAPVWAAFRPIGEGIRGLIKGLKRLFGGH